MASLDKTGHRMRNFRSASFNDRGRNPRLTGPIGETRVPLESSALTNNSHRHVGRGASDSLPPIPSHEFNPGLVKSATQHDHGVS
jgi:hypothetical protein